MNHPKSTTPKWEDLPKEILQIITTHLTSHIDIYRFRSISTTWRSLLPLSSLKSSISPPLNLPPPINLPTTLLPITICRLQNTSTTSSCLVKVVESVSSQPQLLSLPSATSQIKRFVGTSIPKYLNMLDFRLIELTKSHVLTSSNRIPLFSTFRRVVLLGNKGVIVIFNVYGKLAFWGFGHSEWTYLGQEGVHYDDLLTLNNNQNQCYVVDHLGVISWIDANLNLVQYSPPLFGCGHLKSLLVSEQSFYIVDSYLGEDEGVPHQHVGVLRVEDRRTWADMKVYRLDEEWGKWVQVKSLGNHVFVLGKEVNFSVNIGEYPGCQGNCIYFIDRKYDTRNIFVAKFFRLEDGSIRSVECFPTYGRLFSPSMMTSYSVMG